MRSTVHPANERDLPAVAEILHALRGLADTGAALLRRLDTPTTDFATQPWRIGDLTHDWVCAPGTSNAGVVLYLHGRRFQHDEPAEVYAAPLSAATGLPVLLAHYRLAPRHPYPAALDATRCAEKADVAGVDVTLQIYQAMPHGFAVMPLDAAADLARRVGAFVGGHLNGGVPDTAPQPLRIRRLGWASYEITTERGTRLVVDPYFSGSEGVHNGLPETHISPTEVADADVIAVTHAGYDHRGQALEIAQAGKAILVSGTATYQAAARAGIPADRLAPTVSGVEFRFRDLTIKALPAQHESTMRIDGQFVSDQPQSFMVTTDGGLRILCGGDFSLSEQVRTWGEIYRPDVAVLGIGGIQIGPVRVTELQPAEAAIAAHWLGVSTVIPVHYAPGDPAPVQLAANLGDVAQVAVLEFGKTWIAPTRK